MVISEVTYKGELRNELHHLLSGDKISTDAPPDNNGKGDAFSPTDLLATSLAACMLTVIGIKARDHGIDMRESKARVDKIMDSNPRRVSQINLDVAIVTTKQLSEKEKSILIHTGLTCPVAKSLSPDLKQNIEFKFLVKT